MVFLFVTLQEKMTDMGILLGFYSQEIHVEQLMVMVGTAG